MFPKALMASCCAILLTVTPITTPAYADDDSAGNALVAGLALGVLGAAVASSQHHNGHHDYKDHPDISPEENKVGSCMNHTHKALGNRGHSYVHFDHVVDYHKKHGKRITLRVTTDKLGGHHHHDHHHDHDHHHHHHDSVQKDVTCHFEDGKITQFRAENV